MFTRTNMKGEEGQFIQQELRESLLISIQFHTVLIMMTSIQASILTSQTMKCITTETNLTLTEIASAVMEVILQTLIMTLTLETLDTSIAMV